MASVSVYNMEGAQVGTIELSDSIFAVPVNEHLVHQAVVAQLANKRQGTQKAKTRSEVRGGGRKPWRQKGTGHARQGSTRSPQWTGGGVVFAPKPRDFSKKVNKQAKIAAFKSALSAKLAQKELTVVDKINLEQPKTKLVQNMLDAFKFDRNTVIVVDGKDETLLRAAQNIPYAQVVSADLLNTYEVVANKNILATKSAIKAIEEAYVK